MTDRQFILLKTVGLTVCLFLPFSLSANQDLVNQTQSDTQSLTQLVRQFLRADSNSQEEIKDQILAHPNANLETITKIVKAGTPFPKEPVGVLPHQPIQVRGHRYQYGLYVPSTYDPSIAHPLVVCLHGAGFTGDSYLKRWVPRLKNRFILVCPTMSMGSWWTRQGEDLVLATIQTIRARYHIDPDRVLLTGMSNGGIGAWIIGMHHAPVFAGVAPMASGIDTVLYPLLDNLQQTSVYVIHGLHDQVMPVALSRDLVNEMVERKIRHVYREHNLSHPHAGGHFFPREELPGLVEWFDQQRRNPLPRTVTVVRDATHLMSFDWVRIDATDRIAAFSENLIDSRDEYVKGKVYAKVEAQIERDNLIVVNTNRVRRYSVFLNEELVDFSKPVTVNTNGKISYQSTVEPSLKTLLHEARARQDPQALFPVRLAIDVPD